VHKGAGLDAKGFGRIARRDGAGGLVSAIVGTTMTGLPRSSGFSSCSQDAKKLLRSRTSQRSKAAPMGFMFLLNSKSRCSFLGSRTPS
jgi:hypothetical protein